MDEIIKSAVNKDPSTFIELVKEKLTAKFDVAKTAIADKITKNIVEGKDKTVDPLVSRGITGFAIGTDYVPATPNTFVANSDDIASAIIAKLKAKNIEYTKTGLNFMFV